MIAMKDQVAMSECVRLCVGKNHAMKDTTLPDSSTVPNGGVRPMTAITKFKVKKLKLDMRALNCQLRRMSNET